MRAAVFLLLFSSQAAATYSIVACDAVTRSCGVAVATHNIAVGNSVPFARAGVAAGVSQFETNPLHGPAILDALEQGKSATEALAAGLEAGGAFRDGASRSDRQVAVVSVDGTSSAHSGENAGAFAGHQSAHMVSVQGNGLVSEEVLTAMLTTFLEAKEPFAERLLKALEAGHEAGGQTIGVMSAALMVATPEGWPVDVNLREDFANPDALTRLRRSYSATVARQRLFQARKAAGNGEHRHAAALVDQALTLAPDWDRIWLQAAQIARAAGDAPESQRRFCQFANLNPVWASRVASTFSDDECHGLEASR